MSSDDAATPMPTPPVSLSTGKQPQEALIQRGAFGPPATPGTLGRLDRFEILRPLGEGGMGQVYLAREPRTDTRVAVKMMRPEVIDDPQCVHRFLTEARHMYRLSHPRILRVLEVSDRKEGPYYVMPYIEGGSLLGQYSPGQPMPPERVMTVAGQVAEALAHSHAQGLIHRDLKPGNVLLEKDGNAYLTDFGLVRTVFNDSMLDASARYLEGTAPYMSPAVARGEAEDTRCDIYAFGALLYELLAGHPPYMGRTSQSILDQVLKGPPTPLRTVNPKASPALVKIAEGCMARELRDRYASMADVVVDLGRVAKGLAPVGPHRQTSHLPRLSVLAVGTIAVAALAGVAIHHFTAGARSSRPQQTSVPRPASRVLAQANVPAATDPIPFTYTTNNGAITITTYTGLGGAVAIPDMINGLPVVRIGDQAFAGCSGLTGVTIPHSVSTLGDEAFQACLNLPRITIPASVTQMGKNVFLYCGMFKAFEVDDANPAYSSNTDGVLFNKAKTTLISYPHGRNGSYSIPSSVSKIGDWAFYKCRTLADVTIPDSVTAIGNEAFGYCVRLTTVKIPSGVTAISHSSFKGCSGLASVLVDAANPVFSSGDDGVLYNKEKTFLRCYPGGKAGDYVVPDSVTDIGWCSFLACAKVTRVTIPESVVYIRDSTFAFCEELAEVTVSSNVRVINNSAFKSCVKLTRVCFKGDAPEGASDVSLFAGSTKATVYYRPGTKGWGKTFGGRPTAEWKP